MKRWMGKGALLFCAVFCLVLLWATPSLGAVELKSEGAQMLSGALQFHQTQDVPVTFQGGTVTLADWQQPLEGAKGVLRVTCSRSNTDGALVKNIPIDPSGVTELGELTFSLAAGSPASDYGIYVNYQPHPEDPSPIKEFANPPKLLLSFSLEPAPIRMESLPLQKGVLVLGESLTQVDFGEYVSVPAGISIVPVHPETVPEAGTREYEFYAKAAEGVFDYCDSQAFMIKITTVAGVSEEEVIRQIADLENNVLQVPFEQGMTWQNVYDALGNWEQRRSWAVVEHYWEPDPGEPIEAPAKGLEFLVSLDVDPEFESDAELPWDDIMITVDIGRPAITPTPQPPRLRATSFAYGTTLWEMLDWSTATGQEFGSWKLVTPEGEIGLDDPALQEKTKEIFLPPDYAGRDYYFLFLPREQYTTGNEPDHIRTAIQPTITRAALTPVVGTNVAGNRLTYRESVRLEAEFPAEQLLGRQAAKGQVVFRLEHEQLEQPIVLGKAEVIGAGATLSLAEFTQPVRPGYQLVAEYLPLEEAAACYLSATSVPLALEVNPARVEVDFPDRALLPYGWTLEQAELALGQGEALSVFEKREQLHWENPAHKPGAAGTFGLSPSESDYRMKFTPEDSNYQTETKVIPTTVLEPQFKDYLLQQTITLQPGEQAVFVPTTNQEDTAAGYTGSDGWELSDPAVGTLTFNSPATFTALAPGNTTLRYTTSRGSVITLEIVVPGETLLEEEQSLQAGGSRTGEDGLLPIALSGGGALLLMVWAGKKKKAMR